MQKIKMLITVLNCTIIVLLSACGGEKSGKSGKGKSVDLEGALSKIESRRSQDPNASGGNKCLLDYVKRLDDLLTEAEVLEATGFSTDVMEVNYQKVIEDPGYHTLTYQFDNKRVRTSFGYTLPFKDDVRLQRIRPISLTEFQKSYRALTDDEEQAVRDLTDDVVEGKASGADAREAKDLLDASGADKDAVKDAMGSMVGAMKEITKGYRNVDGLADAAVWNIATNELIVLDNGVQFEVSVDVKDDSEENKAIAIALAKRILDKCR